MPKVERVAISYKEIEARLTLRRAPRKSRIEFTPPNLSDALKREFLTITHYFVVSYRDQGIVPTLEEARMYGAYVCMDREAFGGDLTKWDYRDLAREAGVTEEFARFRIQMDLDSDHWRKPNA